MELIDKAAVVAEVENLRSNLIYGACASQIAMETRCKEEAYNEVFSFIDTLEVKEVDLDESARYYLLHEHISPLNEVLHQADLKVEMQYHKDIEDAYKAGFELGLKAQKGE